jgi:hypothetical protein
VSHLSRLSDDDTSLVCHLARLTSAVLRLEEDRMKLEK